MNKLMKKKQLTSQRIEKKEKERNNQCEGCSRLTLVIDDKKSLKRH